MSGILTTTERFEQCCRSISPTRTTSSTTSSFLCSKVGSIGRESRSTSSVISELTIACSRRTQSSPAANWCRWTQGFTTTEQQPWATPSPAGYGTEGAGGRPCDHDPAMPEEIFRLKPEKRYAFPTHLPP